ncbi:MAG TPA: cation transporter [Anaerolineae bacterium]|nr:cation transporter [Anaerolineae bacterium]
MPNRQRLARYAWLSIGTAVFTITLKLTAWTITDSVGLLSDALESGINLITAVVALIILNVAARPPDEEHTFGHTKAEYFSIGLEGGMILLAGILIIIAAIPRLITPVPLEGVGIGLLISVIASLANLGTALLLRRAGQKNNSITLTGESKHLLADVWTSVGVILGVALVGLTGWDRLDPIIALLVAANILYTGWRLLTEAANGLMDISLPAEEITEVEAILNKYSEQGVEYHALRTRQSGVQRFVSVHVQMPGDWSLQQAHTLSEEIELDLRQAMMPVSIIIHLEPIEDPVSYADIPLIRED